MATTLTVEALVDLSLPSDPQISPDGRWVAAPVAPASKRDKHATSAIWLAAAGGGQPARQLTTGLANDNHPRWSPDSSQVAFLSDREERGTGQIHLLTLEGGEALAVTDAPGGVSDLCWLPGIRPRIAYLAKNAQDKEEQERRKNERDDARIYGEFWPYARVVVPDAYHRLDPWWAIRSLGQWVQGECLWTLACSTGLPRLLAEPARRNGPRAGFRRGCPS